MNKNSRTLELNSDADKKKIQMKKILQHKHHLNIQPLFQWYLKLLPFVVDLFSRAKIHILTSDQATIESEYEYSDDEAGDKYSDDEYEDEYSDDEDGDEDSDDKSGDEEYDNKTSNEDLGTEIDNRKLSAIFQFTWGMQ